MNKLKIKRNAASVVPAIVIFIFVISYMLTGYMTLDSESRRVPILVGYVTLFLLALDLIRGFFPQLIKGHTSGAVLPETEVEVPLAREIVGILYVVGFALGIYLAGFLIMLPLYLIASMMYLGQQSLRVAVPVALTATLVIYLVFDVALKFHLFQGVFFS